MGRGEQAQGEVRESDAAKPKVASSQVVLYVLLGMVALIPLYFSPSFHDYEIPKMVMLKVFAVLLTLLWIAGMVLRGSGAPAVQADLAVACNRGLGLDCGWSRIG